MRHIDIIKFRRKSQPSAIDGDLSLLSRKEIQLLAVSRGISLYRKNREKLERAINGG